MNRPDDLKAALGSLMGQTLFPDEVFIVDQSTDERTRQLVTEFQSSYPDKAGRLHYVYQEEKSLVKARNRGLSLVRGDLISFLDDDIVLFEDYYEKIKNYFERMPGLGGLSGNVLLPNGPKGIKWELRKALWAFFLLNDFKGGLTASGFGYPIYECEIPRQMSVQMLPGCNMNFRRSFVGDEIFDEWFKGYSFREDAEFSYRISLKAELIMVPDAKLYHNYSISNRLDAATLKKMEIRNYDYFFRKFKKGVWAALLFRYSLLGIMMIDLLDVVFRPNGRNAQKFFAAASVFFRALAGRIQ